MITHAESSVQDKLRFVELGEVTVNLDYLRKPVKESERKQGIYPYYGASGIIDYVDNFLVDGKYLLIAEDGENLKTRKTPIAFLSQGRAWINNHVHIVIANENAITEYLLYALLATDISGYLTGAVMPKLTQANLNKIRIPLPPLPVQQRIADILGALDDKIELNRRMNATLEAMARALFKSWFVDFDPVHAKAAGQPSGLPAHIDALFPSTFVDSPLGQIPQGWGVGKVGDVIQILSGGTPSTSQESYWNGSVPWYTVKDAPSESDVWVINTEKTITNLGVQNSAAQILPSHTTIISARGTVGKLALTAQEMAMNQSCFGIRDAIADNQFYTYYLIHNAVGSIQQSSHGTVFDTITRQTFSTIDVIIPVQNISRIFDIAVRDWMHLILEHNKQNLTLAKQRDLLLPKLLSGEVEV